MLVDKTFAVYVQMRTSGRTAISALDALRASIETLPPAESIELVQRVKQWEEARHNARRVNQAASVRASPVAQPLTSVPESVHQPPPPVVEPPAPAPVPESVHQPPASVVEPPPPAPESAPRSPAPVSEDIFKPLHSNRPLCPRCGKSNKVGEVFCAHCGNFLKAVSSLNQTTFLAEGNVAAYTSDYFGENSTLVLVVARDNTTYRVQPQRLSHETIIGRSDGGTMKPDIDLSDHDAAVLGVSRLHVALNYNAKNNLLTVSDMKSANSTFINGQKLLPQEVRALRDGDELSVGRLALRVFFQHPDDSLTR